MQGRQPNINMLNVQHAQSRNNSGNERDTLSLIQSMLTKQINCRTHPHQVAKSICIDCKTFCCMTENCGQPHIYHSIENLDYLINNQLMPSLNSLRDYNENFNQSKTKFNSVLHNYKNNLKTFAVEAKKKVDDEHKKIMKSLQTIYNSQMEDICEFFDDLGMKLDTVGDKINTVYSANEYSNVSEINNYLSTLAHQSKDNESFLSAISKDAKKITQKTKEINTSIHKFDFQKEINDVKLLAEREYPKIDRSEYFQNLAINIENEAKSFLQSKKKKEERRSLSKMKKIVMRQSMLAQDNYNFEEDLDLFARKLFDEVNRLRNQPELVIPYLDEYLDFIKEDNSILNTTFTDVSVVNSGERTNNLYNYIHNLVTNRVSLPAFIWDNDLSNSAEDYLKTHSGKVERDHNTFLNQIKEIVTNYYPGYQNINCLSYSGGVEINKIILSILLNESNWSRRNENVLFDPNYNLTGICAVVGHGYNRIVLVMNFSLLNK